jgi:hypothetical protein
MGRVLVIVASVLMPTTPGARLDAETIFTRWRGEANGTNPASDT